MACQEETALSALYTVYSSSRNAGWGQLDLCLTSGQPFFKLKRKIRKCLEDMQLQIWRICHAGVRHEQVEGPLFHSGCEYAMMNAPLVSSFEMFG